MDDEKLFYRIGFASLKSLKLENAKELLKKFNNNPKELFSASRDDLISLQRCSNTQIEQILDQSWKKKAEKEIQFISQNGIETSFLTDGTYPKQFVAYPHAPFLIYSSRKFDYNSRTHISIVGTRKMTEYGRQNCIDLVNGLAGYRDEFVVVSGLAFGVDITAHRAALDNNIPTLGVLAHGLDRIYPPKHKSIAKTITEQGGAMITEYMSGTNPEKFNFLYRNSIIAGISEFVVIVESAGKGGALDTARKAHAMGKQVMAFPGRVNDTLSEGCNRLFKDNYAGMVCSTEDLLSEIESSNLLIRGKALRRERQISGVKELSPDEMQIVKICKQFADGIQINDLFLETKIPIFKLNSILLTLEFEGYIRSLPGGIYRLQ